MFHLCKLCCENDPVLLAAFAVFNETRDYGELLDTLHALSTCEGERREGEEGLVLF